MKKAMPAGPLRRIEASRQGFTLIEILVVAGILALLSVVIAQVLFLTVRVNKKTEIVKDVSQNGEYALETMSRMIQNAKSLDVASCTDKEDPPNPVNSITITNFDNQTTTFSCSEDAAAGLARIASVSGTLSTSYLTNTNITLVDPADHTIAACGTDNLHYGLSFLCQSNNGKPTYVTVSFTLRQINPNAVVREQASTSFKNTIVLRN